MIPLILSEIPSGSIPIWQAVVAAVGLIGSQLLVAWVQNRTKAGEAAEARRREQKGESANIAEATLRALETAVTAGRTEVHELRNKLEALSKLYQADREEWAERWGNHQLTYGQLWSFTIELRRALKRVVQRIKDKDASFDTSDVPDVSELDELNPIKVFRRLPKPVPASDVHLTVSATPPANPDGRKE